MGTESGPCSDGDQSSTGKTDRGRGGSERPFSGRIGCRVGRMGYEPEQQDTPTGAARHQLVSAAVYYGGIYVPHPNKRDVTLELREPSVMPPTPEPLVAPLRVPNDNTYDDKEADRAGMIFVDSTGRYWHRNVNGVLTEETTESYDRLIEKHIAQFPSWRDLRHLGGDALSL